MGEVLDAGDGRGGNEEGRDAGDEKGGTEDGAAGAWRHELQRGWGRGAVESGRLGGGPNTNHSRIRSGWGGGSAGDVDAGGGALQTAKVGAEIGGGLVAELAIFLEGFVEDVLQVGREVAVDGSGRWGMVVEELVEDDGAGGSAEGVVCGGHFVEDNAEGEEVAAGVEEFAAGLLGRHVGDGAEGGAGASELVAFGDAGFGGVAGSSGIDAGEAEVEDFGLAGGGDEDVGGFDVAVEDAFAMGGFEGVGELSADFHEAGERGWMARVEAVERLAVEQLHDEEGLAVGLVDFVDGADAGVVECGGDAGFAVEALESGRIGSGGAGDEFEGDVAAEALVFGFVDHTHATRSDAAQDGVVADGRAGLQIHANTMQRRRGACKGKQRVQGAGYQGTGYRVQGTECRVQSSACGC